MLLKLGSPMSPAMALFASNEFEASAPSDMVSSFLVLPCSETRKPPSAVSSTDEASDLLRKSAKIALICSTSSSNSSGSVPVIELSGDFLLAAGLREQFMEQHAGDHIERLENTIAFGRGRFERRDLHVAIIQEKIHVLDWGDIRQIAF